MPIHSGLRSVSVCGSVGGQVTPADPRKLLEGTTKGPWVAEDDGGWYVGSPNPKHGGTDMVTGSAFYGGVLFPLTEPDARLIAAAPDLAKRVEELEEGLRLIRQLNSWGNTTWPNVVERLLKSAKDGRGMLSPVLRKP